MHLIPTDAEVAHGPTSSHDFQRQAVSQAVGLLPAAGQGRRHRAARVVRLASRFAKGAAGLVVLVAIFEGLRAMGALPSGSVPSAADIGAAILDSVRAGDLGAALWNTALAWFLGVLAAALIGVPLGVTVGSSRWADATTQRTTDFLRPIPAVALVPLAIVVFGIELGMQVFLVSVACVWPILIGTRSAVRAVDPLQLETARTFGLGRASVISRVVLPASLPVIVTSLRVGAGLGVVVVVAAELISGSPGLGTLLVQSQPAGRDNVAWACVVVAGALGGVVNMVLALAERRFASWQEQSTEALR